MSTASPKAKFLARKKMHLSLTDRQAKSFPVVLTVKVRVLHFPVTEVAFLLVQTVQSPALISCSPPFHQDPKPFSGILVPVSPSRATSLHLQSRAPTMSSLNCRSHWPLQTCPSLDTCPAHLDPSSLPALLAGLCHVLVPFFQSCPLLSGCVLLQFSSPDLTLSHMQDDISAWL